MTRTKLSLIAMLLGAAVTTAMASQETKAVDYTRTQTIKLANDLTLTCSNASVVFGLGSDAQTLAPVNRPGSLTVKHGGRLYFCSTSNS